MYKESVAEVSLFLVRFCLYFHHFWFVFLAFLVFLFASVFIHCPLLLAVYIIFLRKIALNCIVFFSKESEYKCMFCVLLSSDCHFFKTENTATIPNDFCRVSWNHRSLLVRHSQDFRSLQMQFDKNIQITAYIGNMSRIKRFHCSLIFCGFSPSVINHKGYL